MPTLKEFAEKSGLPERKRWAEVYKDIQVQHQQVHESEIEPEPEPKTNEDLREGKWRITMPMDKVFINGVSVAEMHRRAVFPDQKRKFWADVQNAFTPSVNITLGGNRRRRVDSMIFWIEAKQGEVKSIGFNGVLPDTYEKKFFVEDVDNLGAWYDTYPKGSDIVFQV